MRISDGQALAMILVMAGITFFIRARPFLLFPGDKKSPPYILYLGKVLPYAIIGMLVVYCLKYVSLASCSTWVPELISILCIVLVHIWKRNTLLSIGGGSLLYIFLVQTIFI